MAKEILAIPEDYLQEVIDIIQCGMAHMKDKLSDGVIENLTRWCQEEQDYLRRLQGK
jgi:hypothetical protein